MPHSVSSESSVDVAMADVAKDNPENSQSDSEGPAPAVADAVNDGSDKENRVSLEDMFDDDSDDDDEFPSSAPQTDGDNSSQEKTSVGTYLYVALL